MPSRPSSRTPSGSPMAPIAVVSSPGIVRTCTPVVSSLATTAATCSSVAPGVITTIMGGSKAYGERQSEYFLPTLCTLSDGMRLDVHQHLWTEPLLSALSARRELPRVRRDGLRWRLEIAGEPPSLLDDAGDQPSLRAALVHLDGLDRALVAPSCALGCEPG